MAELGYLVASVLFILGIKGMTHPRTAVRGNLMGAVGMLIAVLVTLISTGVPVYVWLTGMVVGTAGGVWLATNVQMTQMPQLVALFNGFGGIASVLVAGAEVLKDRTDSDAIWISGLAAGVAGLIGAVTFTGSLVAAAKLHEIRQFRQPFRIDGQQIINAALLVLGLILIFGMTDGSAMESDGYRAVSRSKTGVPSRTSPYRWL